MSADTVSEGRREGGRTSAFSGVVRWVENLGETAFAYLLLTPVFVLLGAIAFYPLLRTLELSMYSDPYVDPQFIGLDNYVALFEGNLNGFLPGTTTFLPDSLSFADVLRSSLMVTLVFTVVTVLFETLIGLGQALVLDQEFRGRRWVRVAIIIPWAVPIVIQGMIFLLMFHPQIGFATPFLADLGIITGQNTLNDPWSSLFIVMLADIWKTSAFMALLILAGLQSIDRSLYDVAKVSGASKWQQFKLITFPLVLPTIGVAILFRTVAAMRVYGIIDTTSKCEIVPSLSCMVVANLGLNTGVAAVIAFVTAIIIAAVVSVIIYQQYREGF
ncbi:carbohydrate ABC transporter permease [Halomarina rubra]|uniref:Carbohydrate ABC transporter permease n=1 Tax=Halomarina rubra TaxID=2071873 RepID=A0ABD6AUC2_9EURY|nr:sugar ABC transporter permease [Halomarina rubra]